AAEEPREQPSGVPALPAFENLFSVAHHRGPIEQVQVDLGGEFLPCPTSPVNLSENGRRPFAKGNEAQRLAARLAPQGNSQPGVRRTNRRWRATRGGRRAGPSRIRASAGRVAPAAGIRPSEPLRVVSGVLKSGWASSQSMPIRSGSRVGPECWRPATSPGIDG